mmetsp:Transcript_5646/g.22868  ORF Transcript_5646/g.22868 Transcript_5646/m.22868 type:complete len:302 (-) Transcript_5646:1129-2034(-)
MRRAPEHQVRRAGAGVDVLRPERVHCRVHQSRDRPGGGPRGGGSAGGGERSAPSEPDGGHRSWRVPEDPDALLGRGEPHFAPRDAEPRRHRAQVHAVGSPKHQQRGGQGHSFWTRRKIFGAVGGRRSERGGDGDGGPRPGGSFGAAMRLGAAVDYHAYALDHRVHRDVGAERGGGILRGRTGLGREPNRRRVDAQRRETSRQRRRRVRRRERRDVSVTIDKIFRRVFRSRRSSRRTRTGFELERGELVLEKVIRDAESSESTAEKVVGEHRGNRRDGVSVSRDLRGFFHRVRAENKAQEPH